ncbi:hypothetical protein BH23BAC1_BH23BAC1_18030 [soil metagenome]
MYNNSKGIKNLTNILIYSHILTKRNNHYILTVLLPVLFFSVITRGHGQNLAQQKNLITQTHVWYRYQNRIIFNEKWEWQNHIDNRRFLDHGHRQHTWVVRIQPFYNVSNKLAVSQSYVFFLQSPHDPESDNRLMVPEHRPFQEAIIKNDLGKVIIRHRYRLEERFFRRNDGVQLLPGYNFNWRLRYQFQAQRILFYYFKENAVHFRIAEELMVNFGKRIIYNTFDQSRFSAAFLFNLNKNMDLETGYSHWFQQRMDGRSFFNRHILRVALLHNIDLRKEH